MADCGAAGTALDRAASVIAGSGGSKHVSSLLGHAGRTQSVMPVSAPTELVLPQTTAMGASRVSAPVHASQPQAQAMHQNQKHHHQQQPYSMMQQMNPMANMQYQQQAMLQMQQQMANMVSHQKAMQEANRTQNQLKDQPSLETWHEGLDKQVSEELRQHLEDDGVVGHEGITHGAAMEELAAAWAEAQSEYDDIDDAANLWSGKEEGLPQYDYLNTEKPENVDTTDWMGQGVRELRAGNLKPAIQAFETELQFRDGDNATAWRLLGQCHAENDMDQQAIVCLEHAVDRDPYCPEALLALGVSYVNELNHEQSLKNLKEWITHNPKFAGMDFGDNLHTVAPTQENAFQEVQQLLQRALEFDPSDAADIQEALGVVYNVSRDYEAAINSFRHALESRPDDYQLWNKLGATLANGNKSEEALPAYHKALQLKPKYARAWLNMAISHSNLQNYDEAARCYLQTLSLNPAATHCWSYLRIALSSSERWDLIQHAAGQDLEAFAPHFDFVYYNKQGTVAAGPPNVQG